MSTHTSPATDTESPAPKGGSIKGWLKGFKPHQLAIGLGIFMGVFTLASGLIPQFTKWHNDKTPSREVFEGIPGALQVAFYTVIPVLLIWGAFRFADRVRNWERGAPDRRRTTRKNVKNRLRDFRAGAYMQTLLRDAGAGMMHSLIYFGFLALLGVTTVLEIDHQLPESLKFLHGRTYMAYSFIGDLAGLVFLAGIAWAIVRRYVQRPYRIRIKTKPEHAAILGVFALIGLSGFFAEAFRIAKIESPSYEKWSFIGYPTQPAVQRPRRANAHPVAPDPVGRARGGVRGLPGDAAHHHAAAHLHQPAQHVFEGPRPPEGCDARDAEPHRDLAGELRCQRGGGFHLEAVARYRRLHDVRPLHQRVPGPRHG